MGDHSPLRLLCPCPGDPTAVQQLHGSSAAGAHCPSCSLPHSAAVLPQAQGSLGSGGSPAEPWLSFHGVFCLSQVSPFICLHALRERRGSAALLEPRGFTNRSSQVPACRRDTARALLLRAGCLQHTSHSPDTPFHTPGVGLMEQRQPS